MKFASIILGIVPTVIGVVDGASVVYDTTLHKMVLNTTIFPAAHHRDDRSLLPRASDAEPTCSFQYGLAQVNETIANIGHLSDVANITCSVPAATCARVSHEGDSSIFFCNFESQDLSTRCGNLIQPAQRVSDTCQLGNRYTYGYVSQSIVVGSQSYPFLVALGDDYAFEP